MALKLVLLHVRGPEYRPEDNHIHEVYLERLAESVKPNVKNNRASGKEVKVTTKVETGEASENICDLVKHNSVDLIIMAAVSSSGLKSAKCWAV